MSIETYEQGWIGIHQSFAETEFGQTLAAQVRYDRYKPEEVSNERWTELLGADVNNLTHLPLTYGLTQSMISRMRIAQPGELTQHDEDVLQVTALIHDWGEAVVGDTTYSDKTEEAHTEEMQHLSVMLEQYYGDDTTGVKDLMDEAIEVARDPNSKLGFIFNTVERLGYMRTALRAADHVINDTAGESEEGFKWIVADVFGNHIPALMSRRNLVPVYTYMSNQRDSISEAFGIVSSDTFLNYPQEQQQPKRDAFSTSRGEWRSYWSSYDGQNRLGGKENPRADEVIGNQFVNSARVRAIRAESVYRVIMLDSGNVIECSSWQHLSGRSGSQTRVLSFEELRARTEQLGPQHINPVELKNAETLHDELPESCPDCSGADFRYQQGRTKYAADMGVPGPAAWDSWWQDGNWWCFDCAWTPTEVEGHWRNKPLLYGAKAT